MRRFFRQFEKGFFRKTAMETDFAPLNPPLNLQLHPSDLDPTDLVYCNEVLL